MNGILKYYYLDLTYIELQCEWTMDTDVTSLITLPLDDNPVLCDPVRYP